MVDGEGRENAVPLTASPTRLSQNDEKADASSKRNRLHLRLRRGRCPDPPSFVLELAEALARRSGRLEHRRDEVGADLGIAQHLRDEEPLLDLATVFVSDAVEILISVRCAPDKISAGASAPRLHGESWLGARRRTITAVTLSRLPAERAASTRASHASSGPSPARTPRASVSGVTLPDRPSVHTRNASPGRRATRTSSGRPSSSGIPSARVMTCAKGYRSIGGRSVMPRAFIFSYREWSRVSCVHVPADR